MAIRDDRRPLSVTEEMLEDTPDDGMVPAEEWAKTGVHQNSSYSCGKCGEQFDSPQEVYDHLDIAHVVQRPRRPKRVDP